MSGRFSAETGGRCSGALSSGLLARRNCDAIDAIDAMDEVAQRRVACKYDATWPRSRCKQQIPSNRSGTPSGANRLRLPSRAATTRLSLVVSLLSSSFVAYYAEAKGLVGKLPGNPASCPEEPCTSDPQHVLRALKHTSYFVGIIFLMPIVLYYMSKLFSKMRDCCAPMKPNKTDTAGAISKTDRDEIRSAKKLSDLQQGQDRGSSAERSQASPLPSEIGAGNRGNQGADRQYSNATGRGSATGLMSARNSSSAGTNNSLSNGPAANTNHKASYSNGHLRQSIHHGGGLSKQQLDSLNSVQFQSQPEGGQILNKEQGHEQHEQQQQQRRQTLQRNSLMLGANQQHQQQELQQKARLGSGSSPKSALPVANHRASDNNNNLIKRSNGAGEQQQYNLQQHRYSMFIGSAQPIKSGAPAAYRQLAGAGRLQMTADNGADLSSSPNRAGTRRPPSNHRVYPAEEGGHNELSDYEPAHSSRLRDTSSSSHILGGSFKSGQRRNRARSPPGSGSAPGLDLNDAYACRNDDDDDGDGDNERDDSDDGHDNDARSSNNGHANGSAPTSRNSYSAQAASRRATDQYQQAQAEPRAGHQQQQQQAQQFSFLSDLYERQKHEQSLMASSGNNLEVPLLGPQHRHSIDGSILNNMLWSTLTPPKPPSLAQLRPHMARTDTDDCGGLDDDDDDDAAAGQDEAGVEAGGKRRRSKGRQKQLYQEHGQSKRHSAAGPATSMSSSSSSSVSSQKRREQLELLQAHQRQFADFQQLQVFPLLDSADQSSYQLAGIGSGASSRRHSRHRKRRSDQEAAQQHWDSPPSPLPPSMLASSAIQQPGRGRGGSGSGASAGAPARDGTHLYDDDRQQQQQRHQYVEPKGANNRCQLAPSDSDNCLASGEAGDNNNNNHDYDRESQAKVKVNNQQDRRQVQLVPASQQRDRRPSLNASAMRRTKYYRTGRI